MQIQTSRANHTLPPATTRGGTAAARALRAEPTITRRPQLDGRLIQTKNTGTNPLPKLDFSSVPVLTQDKMACGTTSLAMVLMYLTGRSDISPDDLDKEIRRMGIGTAPSHVLQTARENGVEAEMYNRSTVEELMAHTAEGRPVMVAIDRRDNSVLNVKDHYMIVTGFETDANGDMRVRLRDPNGHDETMSLEEFTEAWGRTPDGYDNFMMVFDTDGADLPSSRLDGIEHTVAISGNALDIVNNFDRIIDPDGVGSFLHGVVGLSGAVSALPITVPGFALSFAGKWIADQTEDWPWGLRHLGGFVGNMLDAPGQLLSFLGNAVSNSFNRLGSAIEDLASGDIKGFASNTAKAVGSVVEGAVDGAIGAAKSVGRGIKKLFGF